MQFTIGVINAGRPAKTRNKKPVKEYEATKTAYDLLGSPDILCICEGGAPLHMQEVLKKEHFSIISSPHLDYNGDTNHIMFDTRKLKHIKTFPREIQYLTKALIVVLEDVKTKSRILIAGVHFSRRNPKKRADQLFQLKALLESLKSECEIQIIAGDNNQNNLTIPGFFQTITGKKTSASGLLDQIFYKKSEILLLEQKHIEPKVAVEIFAFDRGPHYPFQVTFKANDGESKKKKNNGDSTISSSIS